MWARYAADALGDFGSPAAVSPMAAVFARYSYDLNDHEGRTGLPELCPADDVELTYGTDDRMMETPYALMLAMSRLPLDGHEEELRKMSPYIVGDITSDFDGGVVYEPEAWQLLTAYLLEKANLRTAVCNAASQAANESERFSAETIQQKTRVPRGRAALDQIEEQAGRDPQASGNRSASTGLDRDNALGGLPPEEVFYKLATELSGDGPTMPSDVPYVTSWLPCLCTTQSDVPKMMALLENDNGWIRIAAVKALMFANAIGRKLIASRPEAEYGFSGPLEVEEYQDPAPRWRGCTDAGPRPLPGPAV